jgi:hypothetical protein
MSTVEEGQEDRKRETEPELKPNDLCRVGVAKARAA